MRGEVTFLDGYNSLKLIDLSKVKAIHPHGSDPTFIVYYDKDSYTYFFKSREERNAVLDGIYRVINPSLIKYDGVNKIATISRFNSGKSKRTE